MDSPNVARYYEESDPLRRKKLLKLILEQEGASEENIARKEIFEARYAKTSKADKQAPADGYLGLWMVLEYNKNVGGGFLGLNIRQAQKEIRRHLSKLKIREFHDRSGVYASLIERELEHMVRVYIQLCQKDRTYNSTIFGMMKMSSESAERKLKEDITSIMDLLPEKLQMTEELSLITTAVRKVYDEVFPHDDLDDLEL